jgi:hypothetical protein
MLDSASFRADSDEKIAQVVDAMMNATATADKLRLVDLLSHLKKMQSTVLQSGDENDAVIFDREYLALFSAAACAEEWTDGTGGDAPTETEVTSFKNTVLVWMQIDAEESVLKRKILEGRRLKAQLNATIFAFMTRFDLDDAVCELGTLRLVKSTSRRGLSKSAMLERLSEFFADDTAAAEALKLNLFSAAASVPTARLKRVIPRLTGSPATAARLALTSA